MFIICLLVSAEFLTRATMVKNPKKGTEVENALIAKGI